MTEFNTVKISRILNPTSIDLGEYVVNPFMGCEYSCLYCYVRSNKVVSKKKAVWGTYVDIRVNAPRMLEKEILLKKPRSVLLGSTTECFQPIEAKYRITKKILDILNRYGIYYTILTRSTYIREYIDILTKGFCRKIYFTVNNIAPELKSRLEPKSPPYDERIGTINELLSHGLDITPYFSPILPWISETSGIFSKFPGAGSVEFEGLNFNVGNIKDIIKTVTLSRPELKERYEMLSGDMPGYNKFWRNTEKNISDEAKMSKKGYNIHIHPFGSYFTNTYSKP
jgi:DNA repair photolyase